MLLFAIATFAATPAPDPAALFKSASSLHQRGDYAHSIPILKELVRRSPRNYEFNLLLGEDLLHSGNAEASLVPLRLASEVRRDDLTALTLLADAAIDLGDFSDGAEALQFALARTPRSEPILLQWADFCLDRSHDLGIAMRKSKRGEAAMLRVTAASRGERDELRESLLAESIAKDPEQPGIWGDFGAIQLATGKIPEAKESLKEALRREPERAETLKLQALLAAVELRWSDAEAQLSALAARSPVELKSALSTWPRYLVPGPDVKGQGWDCLRRQEMACSLPSRKPQREDLTAADLYSSGRWEQLIALPLPRRDDATELVWRGVALAKTGDCPNAIPSLERGLSADGLTAGFWLEICYARAGEAVVARLTEMGDEAALHEVKGDLLLRLRNDGAAAEWEYLEALKSRPRDQHLLARSADACDRSGNAAQAKTAALASLSIDAHESLALRILARMALNERDYDEAIERLKQLIATGPPDDWTRVQLGVAYGQSGHPELALHYLEPELRAGYPDPKGALHAMLAGALRKAGREHDAQMASAEASKLAKSALETSINGSSESQK